MIKLLVAYDKNRLIGIDDKLPWDLPAEMEHFKEVTNGNNILMGQVTFDGIGRPLPNRKTTVLTLDREYRYDHEDVHVEYDINNVIDKYGNNPDEHIIICGGATIYKLFIPFVDEMIISEIEGEYTGNVYFPSWPKENFEVKERIPKEGFTVVIYKNINK